MKPISLDFTDKCSVPLYLQIYRKIKAEITCGNLKKGDRLPSLRTISKELGVSLTTSEQGYNQLLIEGYIVSRPQSGFYVAEIPELPSSGNFSTSESFEFSSYTFDESDYIYDLTSFDFQKWKKCMSRVLSDYAHLLLFESDVKGEAALRYEISRYVYSSRGVICTPEQIVIGAGTQQLTNHLCRILRKMNIDHVCTEDPGYIPIQNIFRDHGFGIGKIPVTADGIDVNRLPVNIPSAVYVSPSNQFPTGSVMPIGNRHKLLEWAKNNRSIILEDDYDSELRYFGKPVPALQGLDTDSRVVYLGSFSSTLFPAIKISYMILPRQMAEIFDAIKDDYTQTCSKTEQLTLALFMEDGLYYTNIRKLRALYSQKLQTALRAFDEFAKDFVRPMNTKSGINIIIRVKTDTSPEELCQRAKNLGIHTEKLSYYTSEHEAGLIFYYNQIPLQNMRELIEKLICAWKES